MTYDKGIRTKFRYRYARYPRIQWTDTKSATDSIANARSIGKKSQRDGTPSSAALAKTIGLSEAAVRQRVQRLLDGGLMQIVAVTDPLTLGFARQAMVGLKVTGDLRAIADEIAAIPEVDYVVICAGGFDLLVELVCTDDSHLLDLLNEKVRSIKGVIACE